MNKVIAIVVAITLILSTGVAALALPEQVLKVETEIVSLRTENSKTIYLGGGVYQAQISSGIIHYKNSYDDPNEQWKDIDLTPDKNGSITKAPYTLAVEGNAYTFTDKKTGDYVVVEPIGLNVIVSPFNEGVKLQHQIRSAKDSLTSEYAIDAKGTSVQIYPSATDDDGNALPIEYSIDDGILTETITSLVTEDGKAAKFPITVDPTLTVQSSGKDNYITDYAATTNYGTSGSLAVGYITPNIFRTLLEFPIVWGTDIPSGSNIISATLSLYIYSCTGSDSYTVSQLLRLDWSETESSWDHYKGTTHWTTDGCGSTATDYTTTNQVSTTISSTDWKSWVITNQVKTAQSGSVNVALRIAGATTSIEKNIQVRSREYATTSLRPKLVIVYTSIPTVTTSACTEETPCGLVANGEITDAGELTVTQRGFCYLEGTTVGWVSPTGHSDPDNVWTNEGNAYDNDTGTFTFALSAVHYLELSHTPLMCDKVRIWAVDKGVVLTYNPWIDIDVYYDSAWHNIFSGQITKDTWVEKAIPAGKQLVEKARVYFITFSSFGYIYEFEFNQAPPATSDNVVYENGSFGAGTYSLPMELDTETSYLIRAYAINSMGTGYGDTISVTTLPPGVPILNTEACTDITSTTMEGNADITCDGASTVTRRGFTYAESLKYALDFNGVSDYVEIPYNASYYAGTAAVENFEWGSDTNPLSNSGGSVTWAITVAGTSRAEIDTAQKYLGTRSARLYRDGTNNAVAYFSQTAITSSQILSWQVRKDETSDHVMYHGDGTSVIGVRLEADEDISYRDPAGWIDTGTNVVVGTWYCLEIRNVNWATKKYDIYLNGVSIKSGADMHTAGWYPIQVSFQNLAGTSEVWLDNILVGSPSTWTYETWINRKADTGAHEIVLAHSDDVSLYDRWFQIVSTGVFRLGFIDTAGGSRYVDSVSTIPLNTDTHLTASFDGTYAKVYVNGILEATSASFAGKIPRNNNLKVILGRLWASTQPFEGAIDEVRIWNDVRTQAEIQANMYSELVGNEAGLVGYWKLNEGVGATAEDSTSTNNDGTITGADWVYQGWDLELTDLTEEQLSASISYQLGYYYPRVGQRLTIAGRCVTSLTFSLKKVGSPTGDISFVIRDLDDNIIISKVWGDASSLTSSPILYTVRFNNFPYIDEEVRILAEYWQGGSSSNYVAVYLSGSEVKADEVVTYLYSGSWNDVSAYDATYTYSYLDFTGDNVVYEDGSFGEGVYDLPITDLTPETWYRVRGFAMNSVGIGYGDVVAAQTLVAVVIKGYSWGYILG